MNPKPTWLNYNKTKDNKQLITCTIHTSKSSCEDAIAFPNANTCFVSYPLLDTGLGLQDLEGTEPPLLAVEDMALSHLGMGWGKGRGLQDLEGRGWGLPCREGQCNPCRLQEKI